MKYINREYGFEGRPPFFKEYFEVKEKGLSSGKFKYPEESLAGYGMETAAPNGMLFAGKLGTLWGVRISYQKVAKWVEPEDFLLDMGNFFAANKGGRFAYFNHGDITASIINYKKDSLVLSLSGMSKVKVRVEAYPIAPSDAKIKNKDDQIIGEANQRAVIPGTIKANDYDMEIRDRYEVEFSSSSAKKEYFVLKAYSPPEVILENNRIIFEYALDSQFSKIIFFMAVGGKEILENFPDIEELNNGSNKAELIFTAEKMAGSGLLGENLSNAVSKSVWHKIYDPYFRFPIFIEDRKSFNKYYSYDTLELSTGALIQALMGEYENAIKQLFICPEDKVLGALTAWILFCRTRNKNIIENVFEPLMNLFEIDGELVKADKMTLRELAYKQKNSPMKNIKNDDLYSLDMSSYKYMTLDILVRMAQITNNSALKKLKQARFELKKNINNNLYNPKIGLYMDRYLNGEFIPIYGANSFLPLAAGGIDDIDILERVLLNLKDRKKFGGEFMVPTLSASHPLYGKKGVDDLGNETEPFENYTGMISPRINFLIYLGLKRYGVSELQGKLALSSVKMYSNLLKKYNITPNFYLPEKNKKPKTALRQSLSGNLMAFIGMMEILDVEYFKEDLRPSICFGTFVEGGHRLANIELLGHTFSVNISDEEALVIMDGEEVFKGNGGKFIVRNFVENPNGAEFLIYSKEDITLNISLPIFALDFSGQKNQYTFNVERGKNKIIIDKDKVKPYKIRFNF